MKTLKMCSLLGMAFITLLLTSCSTYDQKSPGPQIETKSPGIMRTYNSFYVSDIRVYSIEGDYLRRIEDREVEKLADDFRRKLIHALGSRHSIVPQPTKNTAQIRVALADVSTTYAAFQLRPGFFVPNNMRGGASIEASIVDSIYGDVLVHVKDTRSGERQGLLSGLGKWDGVQRSFDEWAQMLAGAVN